MEITISGGVIFAMGVAMGVSLGLPFLYVLINRKRMRLIPLLAGIAAYVVINYLLLGLALGGLLSAVQNAFAASFINGAVYAAAVVGGTWLAFNYALKNRDVPDTPLSFGLGYAFIRIIYISGAQAFSNISLATAVNNNGFEKVASTVDDPDALYALLLQIQNTPVHVHLLGGLEMICFFSLSAAMGVLVWYWIKNRDRRCAAVAAAAEFLAYFSICLYTFGALDSAVLADAAYAGVALIASVYAFRVFRKNEGGPRYAADPVSR